MIRKTILVLAIVAILIGATAAALVAQAIKPVGARTGGGHGYGYNELINRPSYMKGKIMEDCLEHPADCAMVVW